MELPEWTIVVAPIGCSRLLVGVVPEMRWQSHTFAHATGRVYAVAQAHRQPTASEPGPLVGEGEQEQKRLREEIGELEAAHRLAGNLWVRTSAYSAESLMFRRQMNESRSMLAAKRRELAALSESLALSKHPSPIND